MAADNEELAQAIDARLTRASVLANVLGALVVGVFLAFLLPVAPNPQAVGRGAVVGGLYVALALPLGIRWSRRRHGAAVQRWIRSGRPASDSERELVLGFALTITKVSAGFWAIAALLLGAVSSTSVALGMTIAATVLLGGMTTCALIYLLYERILRPVMARALAGGPPPRPVSPGIAARVTMAWMLATGVPLLGVAAIALAALAGVDLDRDT